MEKLRVLIVEDSFERQNRLLNLFAELECEVAESGRVAIERVLVEAYDLVCLDYDLADRLTGAEVAVALKKGPSASALVMVHSMNLQGAATVRAILPGAHAIPFANLF